MRISDWSSDVCSSDLPKIVTENEPPPLPAALQRQAPVEAPTPKGPVTFPDEWNAFQTWLAEHPDVPGSQWDAPRVLPAGAPGSAERRVGKGGVSKCRSRVSP